jgi:RNA polymerase sigma-70 factor, ECF subfamily
LSGSGQDYAALLTACGRGDRAALRAIYEQEAGAMIGVAQRILKRRELAEEIVHDAFVQIWRHAARYDPALGAGRAWMFAIVRNRAINALRDTAREQAAPEEQIAAAIDSATRSHSNRRPVRRPAVRPARCWRRATPRHRAENVAA